MIMSDLKENKAITGGEFIIRDVSCDEIFTPEDWTEEHLMMKQTAIDFLISTSVFPWDKSPPVRPIKPFQRTRYLAYLRWVLRRMTSTTPFGTLVLLERLAGRLPYQSKKSYQFYRPELSL